MAAKKASSIPADKIALYDKLIATNPAIERKELWNFGEYQVNKANRHF